MQKNILLNLIAGATFAMSGLISIPAHAQNNQSDVTGNNVFNNPVPVNNQSDATGTNVFNNNLPYFFEGNTVSKETAEQAEQLSRLLRDAYRNCRNNEDCVEFNNLLQESNTFLSNLNQQVETVGNSQGSRAW
ncbi:MAG: hypothetical protein ACFCUV_21080 [Rivularia sp. (in: cyanobacteria)]